MTLTILRTVYDEMIRVARTEAPLEACGLLAGRNGLITTFFRLTNADASPAHFSMSAREQFAAVKEMRANGLKMLAIWHSHPATPARMSAEDLRLAFTPDVAYVVLSLARPEAPAVRAFEVIDGEPNEVEVTLIDQQALSTDRREPGTLSQ